VIGSGAGGNKVDLGYCVAGYSAEVIRSRNWWRCRFAACLNQSVEVPVQKVFKPKFPQLPVLTDYRLIKDEQFWANFPVNFTQPATSNISAQKFALALQSAGVEFTPQVEKVLMWVSLGAEIGCRGKFRAASHSKNAKNAYEHGWQVCDAIAAWVQQGYVYGPVDEEDLPPEAKINGILTRQNSESINR
jgi:hypothetical protein